MTITAIILTAIVALAVLAVVAFIGYAIGYREGSGDYYKPKRLCRTHDRRKRHR